MNIQNFSSRLLESAVDEFAKLPGIGRKTALRLVLHLLNQEKEEVSQFGETIIKLRNEIKHCTSCNTISDTDICSICSDKRRDHGTICVVENARDLMAIENTHQYQGIYHVLGGIISPMDGIGPNDLNIESLAQKIEEGSAREIILALSTTMEGDTTNYFLYKKFKNYPVKITTIARGVSIGDDLEYADEITLGRSIVNRTLFESSV
ncbi:MAG: recombination mediator RecR [Bacteroidales bacterium]|jgi:recombination protein RecR|nr:recombination mediator RecR [Bacteroidales bacterium]